MRITSSFATFTVVVLASAARLSTTPEIHASQTETPELIRASIPGCGRFDATPKLWKELDVGTWLDNQIQNITREEGKAINIANELFKTLAPNCPASQCHCDSFETCSFGSTANLETSLSCDDKKRAFMALDSISNIATLFHQVDEVIERTMNELDRMQGQNVDVFTEEAQVDQAYKAHQKKLMVLSQFLLAFVMVAAGPLSAFVNPLINAITPEMGNKAVVQSLSVAYQGFLASGIDIKHPDKYYESADKEFKGVAVFLERALQQKIEDDGLALLNGSSVGGTAMNLTNSIAGGGFLNRHDDDVPRLRRSMEKLFRGLAINYFWNVDRAYIVMADAKDGNCLTDNRGPSQVRVCLSDEPNKSFWVYHVSMDKEFTAGEGQIKPLKGWRLLSVKTESSPYTAGLVQEDVVRSSLEWYRMHGNTSPSQILNNTGTSAFLGSSHDFVGTIKANKLLPGTFRIPILNNANGEAISSIYQNQGHNYPCMAGPSNWANPKAAELGAGDELATFLQGTGLYASYDWQIHCSAHQFNKCEPDKNRTLDFHEEVFKKNKKAKHPWKKCTGVVKHEKPLVGANTEGYKEDS